MSANLLRKSQEQWIPGKSQHSFQKKLQQDEDSLSVVTTLSELNLKLEKKQMRKDIKNQATSNPVKLDTEPDVAEEEVMEEKLSATKKSIESQKKSTMSLL